MNLPPPAVDHLTIGEFVAAQAAWNRAHDPKRAKEPRSALTDADLAEADAAARARGEKIAGQT